VKLWILFKLLYHSIYYFFYKDRFLKKISNWQDIEIDKKLVLNSMRIQNNLFKENSNKNIKKIEDYKEDVYPLY